MLSLLNLRDRSRKWQEKDVICHVVANGKAVGVPDCTGWLPRETGTCETGPTWREAGAGASGSSVGTALTRDLANSRGDLVDGGLRRRISACSRL
jgi:hypothetical protein